MFRRVVLFLVAYPLLLPSGMCICGAVRDHGGQLRQSACSHPQSCVLPHCHPSEVPNGRCGVAPGVPTDRQCPPSCPASKQADHSKLAEKPAEKWPVVTVWSSPVVPPTFRVDTVPGERSEVAALVSPPLAAPLYIALRTLRI